MRRFFFQFIKFGAGRRYFKSIQDSLKLFSVYSNWVVRGSLTSFVLLRYTRKAHLLADDAHNVHVDHKLTKREQRFLQFASLEYDDVIYMSPMDFLDSLTLDNPRERVYRRVLKKEEIESMLGRTPPFRRGGTNLFRSLGQSGLISYSEYIFLLTLLTKSKSAFKIAFMMFDDDDSGRIDKNEFLMVRSLTSSLRSNRAMIQTDDQCQLDVSEYNFVVSRLNTRILSGGDSYAIRFRVNRMFATRAAHLHGTRFVPKSEEEVKKQSTTLLLHLFGLRGNETLSFEEFQKFYHNLQSELMEIEFHEFARGKNTISPIDFARLVLRYTVVNLDDYHTYINRVGDRTSTKDDGLTLSMWARFSMFLNNLEEFSTAVRLYTNADMPVSQAEFSRAVECTIGQKLDPLVVDFIFRIFDANNDGTLSYTEFLDVMNDRLHRGLRGRVDKHWGWQRFKNCVISEVASG
ncbi:unnamed protein product [Auanema sp. JU1783]|nr:unnamed protein product [Auanema sp. JU1783]